MILRYFMVVVILSFYISRGESAEDGGHLIFIAKANDDIGIFVCDHNKAPIYYGLKTKSQELVFRNEDFDGKIIWINTRPFNISHFNSSSGSAVRIFTGDTGQNLVEMTYGLKEGESNGVVYSAVIGMIGREGLESLNLPDAPEGLMKIDSLKINQWIQEGILVIPPPITVIP